MQFFKTPNLDFVSKRRIAYFISGGLILASLITLIIQGPNYGIDFKGGTEITIRFLVDEGEISINEIRDVFEGTPLEGNEIKSFGSSVDYLIYIEQEKGVDNTEATQLVYQILTEKLPDKTFEKLGEDVIGPRIGSELRRATIIASILALFLILVYIGWRFELIFSFGAIIALFHDVMITLGIFTIMGYELSLKEIAAFLTIIGYSLNDTIVVYDRIRENLKVLRSETLETIINRSINQCLSRTIITSLTTFVVVLVLFLFGGQVIKGFAFAMLIGVVVGTYSSVFVASPAVLEWQSRHGGKGRLKMAKKKK